MAQVSTKYLSLSDDWARAAYALIHAQHPKVDIEPSSVMQMMGVLIDHKLGGQIMGAIKQHGSLFEYHQEVISELNDTANVLRKEAPKRALMFEKLAESYIAALSNNDTFVVPDEYRDIEFVKPVSETARSNGPKPKLPKRVIDEWRDATMVQMDVAGVDVTPAYKTALEENMLTVIANFGHMTQKQFDDEENEPAIESFLDSITGEPNVTMAQYMRQAM